MPKIYNPPPRLPAWPWGGPRSVREKLVDPAQFERKKKLKKSGDPKNPALASFALLESLGTGHSADELRLPLPPHPDGHEADLEGFSDRPHLASIAERNGTELKGALERGLSRISAPPDRVERLKGLLQREAQMLNMIGTLHEVVQEIHQKMREEQREEGY
jgi:hypothetical protein